MGVKEEAKIQNAIDNVAAIMAMEGFELTEQNRMDIRRISSGEATDEEIFAEIIQRYVDLGIIKPKNRKGDNTMELQPEIQVESKQIFEGKVITVTLDTVEVSNGNLATREVVHHNGGAGVVAVNTKGEIALIKQFRYALGKILIEIPAGKIEPGEDPFNTALRELEEEAAVTAQRIVPFGEIIPTCGYCTEIIYLYLATGLNPSVQNLDEDEFVEVFWIPLEQAAKMVMDGEITDSKSALGILKAWTMQTQGLLQFK